MLRYCLLVGTLQSGRLLPQSLHCRHGSENVCTALAKNTSISADRTFRLWRGDGEKMLLKYGGGGGGVSARTVEALAVSSTSAAHNHATAPIMMVPGHCSWPAVRTAPGCRGAEKTRALRPQANSRR